MVSDIVLTSYISYLKFQDGISLIIVLILIFALIGILTSICEPSRSKKARELFADLYVIGKIRQYAKADGIDLEEEMKELRRIETLRRLARKDLDSVVEHGLKEKITAENEKKIEEMTKENKKA